MTTKFWTPREANRIIRAMHDEGFEWVIQHGSLIDRISYEPVRNEDGLRRSLLALGTKEDGNLQLWHRSKDHLDISVRGRYAFVQWTKGEYGDGAPYLTTWVTSENPEGRVEFLVGDTPTPIEKARCTSIETMVRIVIHYFKNKELLHEEGFSWKPV